MATLTALFNYFVFGRGVVALSILATLLVVAALVGFIRTANAIKWVLEKIAFVTGWLLIVLMCITCTDIFGRKLGIPIPLTKFQELEWHMHTAVFSAWMGYNYAINAHPRVDSYTETLSFRGKAWLELTGILVLALPFIWLMCDHSWDFFWTSWDQNERSENAIGLESRWIIKGVFVIGIWLVLAGILSVLLRLLAFLFGGVPADQTGLELGHVEVEV